MAAQTQSFTRKAFRNPSRSPAPKNWAPKMPGPEMPPKMPRLYTNIIWLTIATPDSWAVPNCPTMMLSSRLTRLVTLF